MSKALVHGRPRTRSIVGGLVTMVLVGGGSTAAYATAGTTDPSPSALTSTSPSPTTSTSPSPTPTATTSPTPSPTTTTTTVKHTMANAQRLLNNLGCDAGVVDGRSGTHTTAAIIRFQAANWLSQSGTMNTATWNKLTATKEVACNRRPVPGSSGTGRRIVVSRTQNWVWLVRSDGTVRWQGGIIDNPTVWRSGTYRTGSDCGRPAHNRAGLDYSKTMRLDYFTRLVTGQCGVGFHRIPVYLSSGNQIHPDWYLGTNLKVSHGCMRVSLRTAQEITSFTANSTKVVVKP